MGTMYQFEKVSATDAQIDIYPCIRGLYVEK